MEHSVLHALQLLGTILTLSGALLVVYLIPANAARREDGRWRELLVAAVSRWAGRAALLGSLATALDLVVQVGEAQGQTFLAGMDPALISQFATGTTVGRLGLARAFCLLFAAISLRSRRPFRWPLVVALGFAALLVTGFVSHAAAQPSQRATAVLLQIVHLLAATVWIGGLIHLLLARAVVRAAAPSAGLPLLATLVARFSPIALTAAILLALSGGFTAASYVDSPAALFGSAYGLTLLVKLALLLLVLGAGWYNFARVRPALARLAARPATAAQRDGVPGPAVEKLLTTFCRTLELEVTAGVLVICVAGILASISPPRHDASLRLTAAQFQALSTPHLPVVHIPEPTRFHGPNPRTLDDRRYAEFTHNWSGVMVIGLGFCWLIQSLGRRGARVAARAWPLLLVPFGLFIEIASDPDIWLLRRVPLAQGLADPIVLEHQLGFLIIAAMVWLGLRDARDPGERGPLGPALPGLMIFGSLLLLGHAHAAFTDTQELTNLINVQHTVLGALGLGAGAVRWLALRNLFPQRLARILWPCLIISFGLFLAFAYREVT